MICFFKKHGLKIQTLTHTSSHLGLRQKEKCLTVGIIFCTFKIS